MNPQRTELEYAVKEVLTNLGVPLKSLKKKESVLRKSIKKVSNPKD